MIYGSFPKRSPERRAIIDRVDELLPTPADFPDKRSKDEVKERKSKILGYI